MTALFQRNLLKKARALSGSRRKPMPSPLRCTAANYLLRGLVFDEDGYALTCAAVKKAAKRYRYYVSKKPSRKAMPIAP